ncbi:subtilisin-like serine protease-like protein PR1A [Pyrenochaeta sp. DS3sAY3a]|nr:subtilisin-like serine protease-like protein PR1A [Pyrenochaeta sp. DS3sAY3a]
MKLSLLIALLPVAFALPAPIIVPPAGSPIPGRYIVKMKNLDSEKDIRSALKLLKKGPAHVYNFGNFGCFAAEVADDIVEQLRHLPGVEEEDICHPSSIDLGLARISNQDRGNTSYTYDDSAGSGTCAYVIDTGIATSHPEFEGRAAFLANVAGDGTNTDGNGHGTHCAGTIGSKTYGVAKKTELYAVKVIDASGSGTNSGVIAGINYVANDVKTRSCPNGAVANMSLGGTRSTAVNSAAANAVSAGVFLAVAAGNTAEDASDFSPASEPTVFTVGATDSSDRLASFSNYGIVIDILAPGVSILSTWLNNSINSISGTSMAAPHVAGLAAYILVFEGQKSPSALSTRIQTLALKKKITGLPSSTKNYLAFNGNTRD